MKSTRFWVIVIAAVLIISATASIFILRSVESSTARIYQDGKLIDSINLSRVTQAYTLTVSGAVENTIMVDTGRICVLEATCPDQVCVHQGWISNSIVPVVCLPNALVIQIEGGDSGIDAIAN